MNNKILQFLLVPDSSAARRVKRELASSGGCRDVIVGTWYELVDHARRAYLLPIGSDNDYQLREAMSRLADAFWSDSYIVSPQDTSHAVLKALRELIAANEPLVVERPSGLAGLPERTRRHVSDLYRLVDEAGGCLPDDLGTIASLLNVRPQQALRILHVHYLSSTQPLDKWQLALIEKLNADSGVAKDANYKQLLDKVLCEQIQSKAGTAIARLKLNLFEVVQKSVDRDDTVQWVGVRDPLEEVEVVAGMIQSIVRHGEKLKPSDIAILLPDSFEYSLAIRNVLPKAGFGLSGLPADVWHRDLGTEAVFHFLYCRDRPAPAMAIAACLASALMPWTVEEGARLAQAIMGGDYSLRPPVGLSYEAKEMLLLLKGGDDTPQSLKQALRRFVQLLDAGNVSSVHLAQAEQARDTVLSLLDGVATVPWEVLRRAVVPATIRPEEKVEYTLEGVTIFREGQEPWRHTKHLFVLGFSGGHYPALPSISPVFSYDDYEALRRQCGLPVLGPDVWLESNRKRFKRQIGVAEEKITFLVPRRSASGESLAPSESLVFMEQLFDDESLIFEVSSTEDRAKILHLPETSQIEPTLPREIEIADLEFAHNLLSLRKGGDGELRPESPSSLETLMISPLGWLLRRVYAEPVVWGPEIPDMATLGTLAHGIFEELFHPERELPTDSQISDEVPALLNESIGKRAPFLRAPQWRVERRNLTNDTIKAAIAWRDMLLQSGATIVGTEAWLKGVLGDVPVRGAADLLIRDANDRLLVVDYKRASSGKRRSRMNAGFDSQASLYRTMLKTGGAGDGEPFDLGEQEPGIVYYMMQDQTALSDTVVANAEGLPRWESIRNDISTRAIELIKKRLNEVQDGVIRLNREDDADFYNKEASATPYALEISPLIARFTLPSIKECES